MSLQFSGINTSISVKENRLLAFDLLRQIIDAPNVQSRVNLLQGTPYAMSVAQLENPDAIEKVLMDQLAKEYNDLFEETPISQVVEIFSSQYLYHNLKVLAKMKATEKELSHLLIPIGKYDLDTLSHLMTHLESPLVYPQLVEEVRRTWAEYEVYQLTDAIDVGFDGAYFAHLRMLANRLSDFPHVQDLVHIMIEFYNVISVKRAIELGKNHSFMRTMMTSQGYTPKDDLIELIENQQLSQWFEQMIDISYGNYFKDYIKKMEDGTITAMELEELRNVFINAYLHLHRFDLEGPIQIFNYIFRKEVEISALRIILIGKANQISNEKLLRKVGPLYGEGL